MNPPYTSSMKTNTSKKFDFLPTTRAEMDERGWDACDIILINGDAYIDSPFIGIAAVGRILEREGYRVGIIGQPDVSSDVDIKRLGEPTIFWGVSGGSVDSMVSNYTATKKASTYTCTYAYTCTHNYTNTYAYA